MSRIKISGISGSPRNAATERAILASLQYMEGKFQAITRFQSARRKNIKFCIHCDHCIKTKEGCIHDDDMGPIYEDLEWADAIIMGTPVYHGTLSAQLKAIIDRTRAMVARDYKIFEGKLGIALTTAGDRNGGQEHAIQAIHDFFIINLMIPVAGGAFGANFGITFWSKDLRAEGVDADEQGKKSMKKVLRRVGKLLQARFESKIDIRDGL